MSNSNAYSVFLPNSEGSLPKRKKKEKKRKASIELLKKKSSKRLQNIVSTVTAKVARTLNSTVGIGFGFKVGRAGVQCSLEAQV